MGELLAPSQAVRCPEIAPVEASCNVPEVTRLIPGGASEASTK